MVMRVFLSTHCNNNNMQFTRKVKEGSYYYRRTVLARVLLHFVHSGH